MLPYLGQDQISVEVAEHSSFSVFYNEQTRPGFLALSETT